MDYCSVIPLEQLELLLGIPGDVNERLRELNDWEKWHHERTRGFGKIRLYWHECQHCGVLFTAKARGASDCCSPRCYQLAQDRQPPQTFHQTPNKVNSRSYGSASNFQCCHCGIDYRRVPSQVTAAPWNASYCSSHCRNLAEGRLVVSICPCCKREFELLRRLAKDGKIHRCSATCGQTDKVMPPEWKSHCSVSAAYKIGNGGSYVSKIEAPVAAVLKELDIDAKEQWAFQHPNGDFGCCADFYLPQLNIVVEVQGTYWHSDPHLYELNELNKTQLYVRKLDQRKQKLLKMLNIGYIEIWERDIKKGNGQIKRVLTEQLCHLGYLGLQIQDKN